MALRALLVDMHRGQSAQCNYYPWMSPDRQYHGWEIRRDNGQVSYIYTVPDLDAEVPTVQVYAGVTGDPRFDHMVGRLLATTWAFPADGGEDVP